jgi:hypothetical protein
MEFAQLIIGIIAIAGMVWLGKDPWKRAMPLGIVIGLLLALFASDGDMKTLGIFLMIGCGFWLLIYKINTK